MLVSLLAVLAIGLTGSQHSAQRSDLGKLRHNLIPRRLVVVSLSGARSRVNNPPANKAKIVVIDLRDQRLYAFQGLNKVMEFRVSTAKPSKRTPTGTFFIHDKAISGRALEEYGGGKLYYPQRLRGHILIHGYPSVPRHPASNGCIRMRIRDARKLYDWTRNGTRVIITKDAPDCLL